MRIVVAVTVVIISGEGVGNGVYTNENVIIKMNDLCFCFYWKWCRKRCLLNTTNKIESGLKIDVDLITGANVGTAVGAGVG